MTKEGGVVSEERAASGSWHGVKATNGGAVAAGVETVRQRPSMVDLGPKRVVVVGAAGRVGSLVALRLSEAGFAVLAADREPLPPWVRRGCSDTARVNVDDSLALERVVLEYGAEVVASLVPSVRCISAASAARAAGAAYFDATEDYKVGRDVAAMARTSTSPFASHCGVAPGVSGIVAAHLVRSFDGEVRSVKVRVGALPLNTASPLGYSVSWSVDGLVNQYTKACAVVRERKVALVPPLGRLETVVVDGRQYEAFDTAGGAGTLPWTYEERVGSLDYKALRYPGHRDALLSLPGSKKNVVDAYALQELSPPGPDEEPADIVVVFVSVVGYRGGNLVEARYVRRVFPSGVYGRVWSAIQVATASGVCGVLEQALRTGRSGFCTQESFDLSGFGKWGVAW